MADEEDVMLSSVIYTAARDLYRLTASSDQYWLSVTLDAVKSTRRPNGIYLGSARTADQQAWRKAYALTWSAAIPGDIVTIPANDPLVLDYQGSQLS